MVADHKISEEFAQILEEGNERRVHAWLKANPFVILSLFRRGQNEYLAIPEFSFGTDYRADFLVLSADSGSWYATFIELKAPKNRILLRDGTSSKRLRQAQRQLDDWEIFFRNRQHEVRQEMAKHLERDGGPAQNALMGRNVAAAIEIIHPDTVIHDTYHIIIGRRSDYQKEKRNRWRMRGGFSEVVSTYDRVLDWLRSEENSRYNHDLRQLLRCRSLDEACDV